jgi:uncharacterized protein (DUF58 family)
MSRLARLITIPFHWVWRFFRPRRTIWPTRDGWWCMFAALGLGVAAVNTGNNLLYLLSSMLLGLVVVSGILSEASMRGLRLTAALPDELYAGRVALLGATVANRKRWVPSYSITVEVIAGGARIERFIHVPRIDAGSSRLLTWPVTVPRRGLHRLAGVRVTTRFPFGVFVKSGQVMLAEEVLVFPAVGPAPPHLLRRLGGTGATASRRRGRGHDLHNLRDYLPGDNPRLIHWRSSAKTRVLTVRELEAETTMDTRIVLEGRGGEPERLEAAVAEAASLGVHLLRAGALVELVGPGLLVSPGRGRAHERRLLTALALWTPSDGGTLAGARSSPGPALREIRIGIG